MKVLTFDLSTHERAYTCAALLRAQGFAVRIADAVVTVEVELVRERWATALVHAIEPQATEL